jgi:glycosyltransferase involved in cell wall biosynthesis
VAPQDPAALTAAIRSLLDDPAEWATLAAEARGDAVARFDLARVNDQWTERYRRWLAG